MKRSYNDLAHFVPVDPHTPEGKEFLGHYLEKAMLVHNSEPVFDHEPDVTITYDKYGILSTPCFRSSPVLAVFPEGAKREYKIFCRKFCELYLKDKKAGDNTIKTVGRAGFAGEKNFRAVLWIGADGFPDDFFFKRTLFALKDEKPVYIFGTAMLDACIGKDMDSPFVRSRMNHIYQMGA